MSAAMSAQAHARRRRKLLAEQPALRGLHGPDPRTVWLAALAVLAQLSLAALLAHAPFLALLAVAVTAGAALTHLLGCVIHEAAHNLCARGTLANRLVALAANVPVPLPAAMTFRRLHLQHHRFFGTSDDPDRPSPRGLRLLGGSPLQRALWLVSFPLYGMGRDGPFRPPDRWELAGAALQLGMNALIVLVLGPKALLYLALCVPFQFGAHPVSSHFLGEHVWGATSSYYGALNLLTLNVGHHHEHHDFPGIAGLRLPQVRRLGGYDALPAHRTLRDVLRAFFLTPPPGEQAGRDFPGRADSRL
jgi:sphingolipid delta-4 desaturase